MFLNNLRPYEMEKFRLTYEILSTLNPRIIYANLTGYGQRGRKRIPAATTPSPSGRGAASWS